MATNITDAELQQLLSEGLSQNEIARRTGMPRTTLRNRLKKFSTPEVHTGVSDQGTLDVYLGTQDLDQDPESNEDLRELLEWWKERKRALQIRDDLHQETERKTYHVQKRYIEAIQRAADLEHVSITEIVNRAFGYYFHREDE
jgi:transcriptional regulator with XRE-family HTH domain